ncbi:DUF6894 family protein [Methylobacterium sp. P31]
MPLFFFDLLSESGVLRDDTGLEFDSAEIAYLEACKAIPGLSDELLRTGGTPLDHTFEVTDGARRLLWRIPFAEILGRKSLS